MFHGGPIRPKDTAEHFQRWNGRGIVGLKFVSIGFAGLAEQFDRQISDALSFRRYFFLDDKTMLNYGFVPIIVLIAYISAFSIGFGPVPWLLMGELIPNRVKGLASGLVTSFTFVCMFVTTLEFKTLAEFIDYKFIYLALSLISFSSIAFHVFFLPESKGKSLAELEEYFKQRSRRAEPVA